MKRPIVLCVCLLILNQVAWTTCEEEDIDLESCCSDGLGLILDDCNPEFQIFDSEECKEKAVACCLEGIKKKDEDCVKGIEHGKDKNFDCNSLGEFQSRCCRDCQTAFAFKTDNCNEGRKGYDTCCKIAKEERDSITTEATTVATTEATTPKTCDPGQTLLPDGTCIKIEPSTTTSNPIPRLEDMNPNMDACDYVGHQLCAHKCIPVGKSYKCQCRNGFRLLPDGQNCMKVDGKCPVVNQCHHKCSKHNDEFICSCRVGYELMDDKKSCIDIDECELETHKCQQDRICVNTVGSYRCMPDPTAKKIKCPPGFKLNTTSQVCDDIDECLESPCYGGICRNSIGSYSCEGVPESAEEEDRCPPGFRLNEDKTDCIDINECKENNHDCNKQSQDCLNNVGSFVCQNKVSKKNCPQGYKMGSRGYCVDIDECVESPDICPSDTICENILGEYRCQPNIGQPKPVTSKPPTRIEQICPSGFRKLGNGDCVDIDECAENRNICPTNSVCENTRGAYKCARNNFEVPTIPERPATEPSTRPGNIRNPPAVCPNGYRRSFNGGCDDINECLERGHTCDEHQECQNTMGSFRCNCRRGFKKDPTTLACTDINECQNSALNDCNVGHRCDNTIGSYQCIRFTSCGTGYTLNAHTGVCEDNDECEMNTHDCYGGYRCVNTKGSYKCVRPPATTTTLSPDEYEYYYDENITETYTDQTSSTRTTWPTTTPIPRITTTERIHTFTPSVVLATPTDQRWNTPRGPTHLNTTNTIIVPVNEGRGKFNLSRVPENKFSVLVPQEKNCLPGYYLDSRGECTDIDECYLGKHACSPYTEECNNTDGSYICVCARGYRKEGGVCKYVHHLPPSPPAPPRWSPPPINTCDIGFRLDRSSNECIDVDECREGLARCATGELCINTQGGYKCQCSEGQRLHFGRCIPISPPVFTPPSRSPPRPSTPIRVVHVTKPPQYSRCPKGYKQFGDRCVDEDECADGTHSCPSDQICVNIAGAYMCRCKDGHKRGRLGCEDIDECATGKACSHYATCVNTVGSFRCDCHSGYTNPPTSQQMCMDINECDENNGKGLCDQNCVNTWGSYRCECNRGFRLDRDNRTCNDVDECADNTRRLCHGKCVNNQGSYECTCPSGYVKGRDKISCNDINECENGQMKCAADEICHNTRGGAYCKRITCPGGYSKEPNSKHRCRKSLACRQYDRACIMQPDTISFNYITFASKLQIPTYPLQQVTLFTMKGPKNAMLKFTLKLTSVTAPPGVPPATHDCFRLFDKTSEAGVALVKTLVGPQDILLELSMELFNMGEYEGSAMAKLFIHVSEYDF